MNEKKNHGGKRLKFPQDIIAAATGSIAALPEGMALGAMAGMNPIHGLYASIIGPLIGSWTTSSVYMVVSTTGALALATRGALHGISQDEKISVLVLITILAGIIQILMGIFRLGYLIRFVSNSVMRGFLSAVALTIVLSQFADISGYYGSKHSNKVLKALDVILHYKEINFYALGIAMLTIIMTLYLATTKLKNFSMFFSLTAASLITFFVKNSPIRLVGNENKIPNELPSLMLPQYENIPDVFISSLAIALIGFIQGAGVGHMRPNPDGKYPDSSKDLRGEGLANIASGFFTGIPVGGSVSHTSVLTSAGAYSRWATFISAIMIGLLVYTMSGFIEHLPMAALGGILIISGFWSINREGILTIWETSIQARCIMSFTFIATLAVPIQYAVLGSVVLTFLLHIVEASNRVKLKALIVADDGFLKEIQPPSQISSKEVVMLHPSGSLFFAGAYVLKDLLPKADKAEHSVVIIGLRGRKEIGSTFVTVIKEYHEHLKRHHCILKLVGVGQVVYHQLDRTDLLEEIGKENVYRFDTELGRPMMRARKDGYQWIREQH
ncbi:putative sulfate transporter [Sporocytophaga myxococcoides]|uniref:Putative sulfate transporter n=1 Tax=Sporocytophaga myxococcoides TaxID=153721 RepID=A0A098LK91_9BACT|nr:SulP family inorganic anion transporter [Sporocytophaga myxococcoides]GAL86613.1 putative sulfate transporter [Sporocytophaga myxococcoides]